MSDSTLYETAQKTHKNVELEKIRAGLVDKLREADLPAIVRTKLDIATLLDEKRFPPTPERTQLLADLGVHGVPKHKVRVSISGDNSMVVIFP